MNDEQKNSSENSIRKIAYIAVVFMLLILIFIALFSFFLNMQAAISDLFDPRFQSLMQAIFSLIVLSIGVFLLKKFFSR